MKKQIFLLLLLPLATMFKSSNMFAADPPQSEYDAAMTTISESRYYLVTEVNGTKWYVTQNGNLTDKEENACSFAISKDSGTLANCKLYNTAFLIDPGTGSHFGNTTKIEYLGEYKANLHPSDACYHQVSENRNDWERQVFYLKDGKFAIRASNTEYGESGWLDAGRVFWTYEIAESDIPVPCYSYEPAYIWTLELSPIPIPFADAAVKAICVANWDTNSDGELSYAEAAAVTDLGEVFKGNSEITSFNELQYFTGLTKIGDEAFSSCNVLTSITIPNNVTSIEADAFWNCTGLTSITIPNSVTSIGNYAFAYCNGLTSITIPNSVTSIGAVVFQSCTGLTSIIVESENLVYMSKDGVLYNKAGTTLITYPAGKSNTSYTIPNSVTSIGSSAFYNCSGLTSVTIPNSVTSIGDYYAFQGCSGLTSVNIPNSVTSIGYGAFQYCSGLTSITIGNSVTSIGNQAFYSCTPTSVTVLISQPLPITENTFSNRANATLYVPAGSKAAYEAADIWKEFKEIIDMGQSIAFADAAVKALCVANWDTNNDGELSYAEAAAVTELGEVFRSNQTIISFAELQYFTGLEDISNLAFFGCTRLKSIAIPEGVTTIGDNVFAYCMGLTSINIPNSVIRIGEQAFLGCSSLTNVIIPNGVTSIDACAFSGCTNLSDVVIPQSVISIGYAAFVDTPWDENLPNGLIYFGSVAYKYKGAMPENASIVIKEGTTQLASQLFYRFRNLSSITIPEGVINIGDEAFKDCIGLTSITIPESMASISASAFNGCSGLTSIEVKEGNAVYDSRNDCNAIIETASNTLITGCINSTIPEGVTCIGLYAFWDCKGLASITIPESVTSIGNYSFWGCTGLTSITIPESVTSIGYDAFTECSGLTTISVDNNNPQYDSRGNCNAIIKTGSNTLIVGCSTTIIPDGVTNIGFDAFRGRSSLTSITIPNSVNSIESQAFYGCSGLTSVTVLVSQPLPITESTFSHRANATLFVPAGSKAAYEAADYWKDFKEIIDLGQSIAFEDAAVKAICVANWDTNSDGELSYAEAAAVTSLGEVFKDNTSITSFDELQYFTGLAGIGYRTFWDCTNLASVTIPDGVTIIESQAFCGCSGLTSVNIPNGVTSIGLQAFCNCFSLTPITIPDGVTFIGAGAFSACHSLTSIFIPKSVTYIDNGILSSCNGLVSIDVDEGNTIYDSRNNCNAIIKTSSNTLIAGCKNTTIPNSVTSIGTGAFSGCRGLTSITIQNGVTSIGEYAFSYCSDLTTIVVEEGNTIYDSRNNCNAIIETASNTLIAGCKNTTIPNSVTSIGGYAFSDCGDLTSITIPNGMTNIGEDAFQYCRSLASITIPNTVTSIGEYAFSYCSSLTNVVSEIEVPFAFGDNAFSNISDNCVLTVPAGTRDAYIAAGWTEDVFKGGIVEMVGTMTDISQMDNAIYVEPMEGKKGDIVPLEVKLKNAITPVGCSFKLTLPEGFSLVKDTDGDVIYEKGERANKMSVTMKDWNNGSYDFALTPSSETATIPGNDGTFIKFSVKVPDDAVANQNYSIQLTNNLIQSKQDVVTDTPLSDVRTNLYVFDYILGDVNGDKNVTPADAIMILYHYFNVEQNGFNAKAADLNGDKNITPADAIEALYLYFGMGNSNAVKSYRDIFDSIDTLDPQ